MRIATYNVEWFNALFDDDAMLLVDQRWSGRYNVTRQDQIAALGVVFAALDADVILLVEAPDHSTDRSTISALQQFCAHFGLRTNAGVMGFANETQQELAILYDPKLCSITHTPHASPTAPRFDGSFDIDLDIDARLDRVQFSKPPLETQVQLATGSVLDLIGVHLKSKAPYGARNLQEAMQQSIKNRRKQLAQAIWLRRRISDRLAAGADMIVLGDFNDGPGLDTYETLFGRSSIEIIAGAGSQDVPMFDPHITQVVVDEFGDLPYSARFQGRDQAKHLNALIDYIFVSPELTDKAGQWRIWNPYETQFSPELTQALITASDHFPVTLDIDLA
jgi:predicted extracellular nuclease